MTRRIDAELAEGVYRTLLETKSFREAGRWLDQKLEARRARSHGTRCPGCAGTTCSCTEATPTEIRTMTTPEPETHSSSIIDEVLRHAAGGPVDEDLQPICPRPNFATIHVSVYAIDQRFGGPEEGGWWYDVGTVLESHTFRVWLTEETAALRQGELAALEVIASRLESEYDFGTRNRFSCANKGSDHALSVSWLPPADFPKTRPHYE